MASENAHLVRVLSPMIRAQYVQRSKESALALLTVGRIREAVASMMDMRKHLDCGAPHEINAIGIFTVNAGDVALARAYIEGFK